jgi:CubicO group peptidase (beta-lactamase class C family)
MNVKKYIYRTLLVGAVLSLFLRAFPKRVPIKPVTNRVSFDGIDDYIKQQMHRLNIPGLSLAIVEGERIVHLRGFGRARPGGEAPSPQTPFFIGSLTKSFTGLAVILRHQLK